MNELKKLQALDLETKILKSKRRIREWYYHFGGSVYISFSGGKDSTVLLHLVRSEFPDVPAVFVDTGLEFPEIREFVKTIENVIWVKPKMNFTQVVEKYGYPLISKDQAQFIYQYRTAKSERTKNLRWNGDEKGRFKISEKWKPLVDLDFKISDKCCDIMKKTPSKKYEKETGRVPFIGTLAEESSARTGNWNKYGCNAFDNDRPTSKPLSFWCEKDIWEYIKINNLAYSEIYDKGYEQTGCMACGFGIGHPKSRNKMSLLKETHPKIYRYAMEYLGLGDVITFMENNCGVKKHNKE